MTNVLESWCVFDRASIAVDGDTAGSDVTCNKGLLVGEFCYRRSGVFWVVGYLAVIIGGLIPAAACAGDPSASLAPGSEFRAESDRSPVDVGLVGDGRWLVTANQTSDSVSLVDVGSGTVAGEWATGRRPEAVLVAPDGRTVLISCAWSGTVEQFEFAEGRLRHVRSIRVGFWPVGMAFAPDLSELYVALNAADAIAVVDWRLGKVVARIAVGRWPRYMVVSEDGKRLAVGVSGDRGVAVVDTRRRQLDFVSRFGALNIGHLQRSRDGAAVYFPWMTYRRTAITPENIRLGWVLGSRVARLSILERQPREALALDVPGEAVADPHGIAITSDERWMAISAGGTHELLVLRLSDLPLSDSGVGNHLPGPLRNDRQRFTRIALGGRPLGMRLAADDRTLYVANYLRNSVQVVDMGERRLIGEIWLGGPSQPSLARRGEAIFYDARRSLDQWYSCHTCHFEGGTNAEPMDTHNDGSVHTYKMVLPLYHVTHTAPWTWHGWQEDLRAALVRSFTSTMQGPPPTDDELDAMLAFLAQLSAPPNPWAEAMADPEAVARGRAIFHSPRAGCSQCHRGPYYTDGQLHDVGLGSPSDRYPSFNTPSLIGLHARVRYLHDGRATSLEQLLAGPHAPQRVAGEELTAQELADLVAFLRTL